MARKPAYDMIEIPSGKHPAWQDLDNRVTFEEDMRIHLYEALDNLTSSQISEEERMKWEAVIASLGQLGEHYKEQGFPMHVH